VDGYPSEELKWFGEGERPKDEKYEFPFPDSVFKKYYNIY